MDVSLISLGVQTLSSLIFALLASALKESRDGCRLVKKMLLELSLGKEGLVGSSPHIFEEPVGCLSDLNGRVGTFYDVPDVISTFAVRRDGIKEAIVVHCCLSRGRLRLKIDLAESIPTQRLETRAVLILSRDVA